MMARKQPVYQGENGGVKSGAQESPEETEQSRRDGLGFGVFAALAVGFFELAFFELLLALDAMARPRHGLEALGVDFFAAGDALAKTALADAGQGIFDHLQKRAVVVALGEQKFLGVRTGGAIGDIGRGGVLVRSAAILLRTRNSAAEIVLPRFQSLLKVFDLLLIHVSQRRFHGHTLRPNEDNMRVN
jgi:hypothetical protein